MEPGWKSPSSAICRSRADLSSTKAGNGSGMGPPHLQVLHTLRFRAQKMKSGEPSLSSRALGTHDAVAVNLANAVVPLVRDIQIAGSVCRHIIRKVQLAARCRAAIPRKARGTAPCNRRDNAVRADPTNALVIGVGDVQISGGVGFNAMRVGQQGTGGGAAIACEPRSPSPCHCSNGTVRGYLANAMVPAIRDVQIACAVQGYALGVAAQLGARTGATIAREPGSSSSSHAR